MYLTREANLATIRSIAGCSSKGSELAFNYVDEREFDPARQSKESAQVQRRTASLGEAWISGFDPAKVAAALRTVGLQLREDLDGEEISYRYYGDCKKGLRPLASSHYALAHAI